MVAAGPAAAWKRAVSGSKHAYPERTRAMSFVASRLPIWMVSGPR